MVLPEGAPGSQRNRPKTLALAGVALFLVVGVVALGLATTPAHQPAERSTPTTEEPLLQPTTTLDRSELSLTDIVTGPDLAWSKVTTIPSRRVIGLQEHRGHMYLFTSEPQDHPWDPSPGMEAWISLDGVEWNPTGAVVGPDYAMARVDSAGDDLIALGNRVEDGSPHIFISPDGLEWARSQLPPVEPEPGSATTTRLGAVASVRETLLVTAVAHADYSRGILEGLPPEIATLSRRYGMGLSEGPSGRAVELYGPLGLVVYSATLDELGIDEETVDRYFNGTHFEKNYLWSSEDRRRWTTTETGDFLVVDLWTLPDGTLIGSGWDSGGPAIRSSDDGLNWLQIGSRMVTVLDQWNGSLLGTRNERELVRSADGHTWESFDIDSTLPTTPGWRLGAVAAGGGKIAVVAEAWLSGEKLAPPPTIRRLEGHTLTLDQASGELVVDDGAGRRVSIALWTGEIEDAAVVDLDDQQATFLDPETGAEMITLSFAVLEELEVASYGVPTPDERILLIGDGNHDWRVVDLSRQLDRGELVATMRIVGDRLILITYPADEWRTGSPAMISIRTAALD